MLKPTLVSLFEDPTDTVTLWPEFRGITAIDVGLAITDYRQHGMPIWCHEDVVVSLPEGSEHALEILLGEMTRDDVLCISVRRRPGMYVGWWTRLETAARSKGIYLAEHRRHEVVSTVAYRLFRDGLRLIEDCADLVRGEGVDPSPEAMRTEKALTKAVEALNATGFTTPRTR